MSPVFKTPERQSCTGKKACLKLPRIGPSKRGRDNHDGCTETQRTRRVGKEDASRGVSLSRYRSIMTAKVGSGCMMELVRSSCVLSRLSM